MKLVLTHDVPSLGKIHDIVEVKAGYGRNFLLPRNLAVPLTAGMQKALELDRAREKEKHDKVVTQAAELAKTLDGLVIQFRRKTAKGGKLYGSISRSMILKALKTEHAIELPASAVKLADPIRGTGTTKVPVHLHEDQNATLTIKVAAEK